MIFAVCQILEGGAPKRPMSKPVFLDVAHDLANRRLVASRLDVEDGVRNLSIET